MFGEAMRMLAADDETETLLLVSKPPAREAVQQLGEIDVGGKRVVAAFVGWDGGEAPFEIHPTLEAGAYAAAGCEPPRTTSSRAPSTPARGGRLLGLFSGGSLAYEAMTILGARPRRSSTSARRSTRRAARTRWSTSRCACGCCSTSRRRRRLRAARRRARPRLARRPRRRAGAGAAQLAQRMPGDRARVRHAGRPAGRPPAGGDAARGRRDRRADERRRGAPGQAVAL